MDQEDFLTEIYQATKTMAVDEAKAYLQKHQRAHPNLQHSTIQDLAAVWLHQDAMEREHSLRYPIPTAEDLWSAVCAWSPDPLHASPRQKLHEIFDLICSPRFAPVPLGKYRGEFMCALEPEVCLAPELDSFVPMRQGFDFSGSNGDITRAIRYADGHPSEGPSDAIRTAVEDCTLRRFVSLGYILMLIDGNWTKTGHALVLDADYGRNCHPWLVLSAEWETDDENYVLEHETEFVRPPKKVARDDAEALGVLPGHSNRTTIARFTHWAGRKENEGPEKFVTHFGEDFSFDLSGVGELQGEVRSPWGPGLAQILNWWWDPIEKEEVCYTDAGIEYMRYNPLTREYRGCKKMPLDEVSNTVAN